MGGVNDPQGIALPAVVLRRHQNGGSQLIVEIIDMHHIGTKELQKLRHFPTCFDRIDNTKGIGGLSQERSAVEIHIRSIQIPAVAHDPVGMFHAEIFHLMPQLGQMLAQAEHIGLCTAGGVEEFVDHQDFHALTSFLRSGDSAL